jgi:hypothetical protein
VALLVVTGTLVVGVLPSAPGTPRASAAGDPVIVAAGDIACDPTSGSFKGGGGTATGCRQRYTADLIRSIDPDAVLALGDNQYSCGGYSAFMQSYDPSWGAFKSITHPVVGNHEYLTTSGTDCTAANAGAAGYFDYYGAAAGQPGQGYYSFDVGTWHLIALNSNCSNAGGCGDTSPQGRWLANDLATHHNMCTLAYWHIPLFSSGGRAASNSLALWKQLYNADADVVLNGHDHTYERFAPQTPSGQLDTARGIREFVVGTGGADHTTFVSFAPNSEVGNASTFGVLKLTLHPSSYDWQFVPEAGQTFTDSGTTACHGTPAADTTAPSAPTGVSATPGQTSLGLSWAPATDDVAVSGYSVYVGGAKVGSTATTAYSVTGLTCGARYDLAVEAYDAAGNVSARAPVTASTSPCPPPGLFADDFESGDLSRWTANLGLAADPTQAHAGSFGVRAASGTGGAAAWAYRQLPSPQGDLDATTWFRVNSLGANVVDLMKLRTASGTALLTVFATPTGRLGYQNNVTTLSTTSTTPVSSSAWHKLEVHVVVNGDASRTQTFLDDQPVAALTRTESLGTTPVGRVQVGENLTGRSYDVGFDDVRVSAPDATPPSTPTGLTAAPGQSGLDLSWTPSTDDVGVTGYDVYLGADRVGSTTGTSFPVTGLLCGASYDVGVEAHDAAGNVSPRAPLTASTAACLPTALFADDFETGSTGRWTSNLGLVADPTQAHGGSFGVRAASGAAGAAAWAYQQLPTPLGDVDAALWFRLNSIGPNVVDLMKLRTATGTALLTVFATSTGRLGYQNNVTSPSTTSSTVASMGAWHKLEVHVVVDGDASRTETLLDNQPVAGLTKTESLGTTPVGRFQVGENIAGRTYDVGFDDVAVNPGS